MTEQQRLTLAGGVISWALPAGWQWHPEAEGGGAIPPERDCVLHLRAEQVQDPAALPNLSRMLAGFLTGHVGPVAPDELHSFSVPGGLGFAWQYMEEWEEPRELRAVRVWVMGSPEAWVFVSFQGPRDRVHTYGAVVDEVIAGFSFASVF